MRGEEKRMIQEPDRSFIIIKEDRVFPEFHYHPEYELTYMIEGRGRRIVGDHVDNFQETDLVFLGSYLPHEYTCESHFLTEKGEFLGKAIVIQFQHDFLGKDFFNLPENLNFSKVLAFSLQGIQLYGKTKRVIVDSMFDMLSASNSERLYILFRIFEALASTKEYNLLSSPSFIDPYLETGVSPISKAREYILQNFQTDIRVSDLLEIANMSNTTFCSEFKRSNNMNFKKYLTNVRIGYACRLLIAGELTIAEIGYKSGFDNLSNFNRQFKHLKGITPNQFKLNCRAEGGPIHKNDLL
jgi:AraC-like DNA-binding protein